jgi:integrase
VKNETSKRRVPIHSALIKLGFLGYIQAMKDGGKKLLFPQWKPARGKASHKAERWFISFLKRVGLRDESAGARLVGMHAFRSTFLNRAYNLRIADAESITGRAGEKSEVVRGYLQ